MYFVYNTFTDTCPGTSRSHSRGILILAMGLLPIAHPLIVPTQDSYWCLLWDCYLKCTPTSCAHSRGILILGVGLLPISYAHSLCPLKRHTDTCRGIAAHIARPLIVPTQDAYWYLPWYCYWSFGPLYAPLKWHLCQLCGLSLKLSLL